MWENWSTGTRDKDWFCVPISLIYGVPVGHSNQVRWVKASLWDDTVQLSWNRSSSSFLGDQKWWPNSQIQPQDTAMILGVPKTTCFSFLKDFNDSSLHCFFLVFSFLFFLVLFLAWSRLVHGVLSSCLLVQGFLAAFFSVSWCWSIDFALFSFFWIFLSLPLRGTRLLAVHVAVSIVLHVIRTKTRYMDYCSTCCRWQI